MRPWFVGLIAAGLPACLLFPDVELIDIELDQCGNGLLEPNNNEDCDLVTDSALGEDLACGQAADGPPGQCRYLCSMTSDFPACPNGWVCGLDQTCRFAGGEYDEGTTTFLGVTPESTALDDFDGDGRDDILVLSDLGLGVGFSGPLGTIEDGDEFSFGFRTQMPPAILDLNEDERTDAALPIGDGILIILGADDRAFRPTSFPLLTDIPPIVRLHYLPRPEPNFANNFLVVLTEEEENRVAVCSPCDEESPASFTIASDLDGILHTVTTSSTGEFAFVSVHDDTTVHMFRIFPPDAEPAYVRPIELPAPSRPGLWLSDIDGDGQEDLLINSETGPMVAHRNGDVFQGAVFPPFSTMIETVLDVGDLDGDGRDDFLTPAGIFIRPQPDAVKLIYETQFGDFLSLSPWREAIVGDFNTDGRLDVAATATTARVLVLFNGGPIVGPIPIGFNNQVLTTSAPVRELTVGDFDGDLADDLAFVEDDFENDPEAGTTLTISFGTGLGVMNEPIDLSRIDFIRQLETADLQRRKNPEVIQEILVESSEMRSGEGPLSYSFLEQGDALDRRLGTLLIPPIAIADNGSLGVIALSESAETSTSPIHLLNIRTSLQNPQTGVMYVMRRTEGVRFPQSSMTELDLTKECMPPSDEPIDHKCLTGQAGPFSASSREAAFLFDTCRLDLWILFEADGRYRCQQGSLPPMVAPENLVVAPWSVVDLNDNGRPEYLWVVKNESELDVVIGWDEGFDVVTEIRIDNAQVVDLVPIDVDRDPDLELLLLTDQDLQWGDISPESGFVSVKSGLTKEVVSMKARLELGDLNGDGYQDVIVSDEGRVITWLGRPNR